MERKLSERQIEIISALAFGNMNIAAAARMIGCHRNTLVWHIEQIRQITGKNPMDFFDLMDLFRATGGEEYAD